MSRTRVLDEGGLIADEFEFHPTDELVDLPPTDTAGDSTTSDNILTTLLEIQMHMHTRPSDRTTAPYLTKFEKARLIGIRAAHINAGSPVMIDVRGEMTSIEIAEEELKQRKVPYIIVRPLPNGTREYWRITDFDSV